MDGLDSQLKMAVDREIKEKILEGKLKDVFQKFKTMQLRQE